MQENEMNGNQPYENEGRYDEGRRRDESDYRDWSSDSSRRSGRRASLPDYGDEGWHPGRIQSGGYSAEPTPRSWGEWREASRYDSNYPRDVQRRAGGAN